MFMKSNWATAVIGLFLSATAQAVMYNVITEPLVNMSVVVVVDKAIFPLKVSSGILHQGDAPPAKVGYNYGYVVGINATLQILEPFVRAPFRGESSPNEFFNRSVSIHDIHGLPKIFNPLQNIHRIQSDLHQENQIPTIHLYGNTSATKYLHENQQEDIDIKLNMAYFGLNNIQTFENVKVSLSGRSSRWIPKLSYGLKLEKKNEKNLFGYKNFKLRALAHDFSYVREHLCHHIIRSCGIPGSGTSYVRLFIDNKAVGLFGLIETFNDPWLASEFSNGDKSYKSGDLYQSFGYAGPFGDDLYLSDLRYEGENMTNYSHGQYKIKEGPSKKSSKAYGELKEFIDFINSSTTETTFEIDWEKKLDIDGFFRAMAVENLLGLSDAYMSMANNYYLYKDPKELGRITYIPTDFDTSIGKSFYNLSMMTSGNYSDHPGVFFRPLTKKLLSYAKYSKLYQELLLNITVSLINPVILNPYIDSVVDMIRVDVEWDSQLPKIGTETIPSFPDHTFTEAVAILTKNSPPGLQFAGTSLEKQSYDTSFDKAINGTYSDEYLLGVKVFIARKSSAIIDFYNKNNL